MGSITVRVRSLVWFVSGAVVAAAVMVMFANAWQVDAAPGDDDATFVGVTPCRLADTRPAPNRVGLAATLGTEEVETFVVVGSNGECSIPPEAVAVSLNVTALGASELSFLTFWPDGDRPLAASLNPAPGQPPVPNAVTVALSAGGGFNVYNASGNVDVVIDVNGYYLQDSLLDLDGRLSALETDVAVNTNEIAGLDAAQPFAVTARGDDVRNLTGAVEVVSVEVTAPVDGHVTVNSTTSTLEFEQGVILCSITTGSDIDWDYTQRWQRASSVAQMAGTRTFPIAAGSTETYNLICEHGGAPGDSELRDPVLTAIFTPAP